MFVEFVKVCGGGFYYFYFLSGIGKGLFVELVDGSVKFDMIGGIGVYGLGYSYL